MASASDHRLLGFLAASLALHLLWLAIPLRHPVSLPAPAPLVARLVLPAPAQKSAVAARRAERGTPTANAPGAAIAPADIAASESAAPAINLDAAFAIVRSQAREAPPRAAPAVPQKQITVEAAVARATQRQALVETRGAAGEYVTMNGDSRCVTPLMVPHFLEGKTMLTQCQALKG
jgi:hypothetical protein